MTNPTMNTNQPLADGQVHKIFEVIDGPVRVRVSPGLEPRLVIPGLVLNTGDQVKVNSSSRQEVDNYVWWEHSKGWSAERSMDSTTVFMAPFDPTSINSPPSPFVFQKLPLDLNVMHWLFYYGNTEFAFQHGAEHNYDGYSQGLHGGLDFGHPGGAAVRAGVTGTFDGPGKSFGPNRLDVLVGNYRIIYGHLASPTTNLKKGDPVTVDTQLGIIDKTMQHTHIEIRQGTFIYNPLQFIPDQLRSDLLIKFPPTGPHAFHRGTKWQTPLDQPKITLGGPVIGPRAKS